MTMNTQPVQPAKMLRLVELLPRYGTAKSQFHQDVARGLMTAPVKPSRKVAFWPESELDAINAARIAGRSHEEIRALVCRLHEKRQSDATTVLAEA